MDSSNLRAAKVAEFKILSPPPPLSNPLESICYVYVYCKTSLQILVLWTKHLWLRTYMDSRAAKVAEFKILSPPTQQST